MGITRQFRYEGNDPRLVEGQFYTYAQLCEITGITYNTLKNRLYKDETVTDNVLYTVGTKKRVVNKAVRRKQAWPRLETKVDYMSQERLRRPLI